MFYYEFKNQLPPRPPALETPWGTSDCTTRIAEGIVRVSTPSHGGYKLDAARQAQVPAYMRDPADSFGRQRAQGWYEEDCDWAIVCLVFPQFFPEEAMDHARGIMRAFRPAMLNRWDAGKVVAA